MSATNVLGLLLSAACVVLSLWGLAVDAKWQWGWKIMLIVGVALLMGNAGVAIVTVAA
jgi:hypothetical protein